MGADDRRPAQAAGLCHRPVRQEPPRRSRFAPAHGARLRRIPRQPVPPERRGRTRNLLLPEGPRVPQEVRPARRAAHLGRRQGRADDQGHRRADAQAHGDGRPGNLRRRAEVRRQRGQGRQALLRVVQHHAHARVDAAGQVGRGPHRHRPVPRRHGRARRHGGRGAQAAGRSGHRRQHHRRLRHRQRRRNRHLARRRHHAVPRREGHDLGRRFSRTDAGALAGCDQAGHDRQRHLLAGRLAADAAGRGRACRTSSRR